MVQSFNKLFIVVDYQLNKDFIAKNLCENRNKPMMHCNGKCHMMKQLKQDEKKDQENPERKTENKFEIICSFTPQSSFDIYYTPTIFEYPVFKESITIGFHTATFHPPQV